MKADKCLLTSRALQWARSSVMKAWGGTPQEIRFQISCLEGFAHRKPTNRLPPPSLHGYGLAVFHFSGYFSVIQSRKWVKPPCANKSFPFFFLLPFRLCKRWTSVIDRTFMWEVNNRGFGNCMKAWLTLKGKDLLEEERAVHTGGETMMLSFDCRSSPSIMDFLILKCCFRGYWVTICILTNVLGIITRY